MRADAEERPYDFLKPAPLSSFSRPLSTEEKERLLALRKERESNQPKASTDPNKKPEPQTLRRLRNLGSLAPPARTPFAFQLVPGSRCLSLMPLKELFFVSATTTRARRRKRRMRRGRDRVGDSGSQSVDRGPLFLSSCCRCCGSIVVHFLNLFLA